MRSSNFKKMAATSALGLAVLFGAGEVANAQGNRNDDRKAMRQQEKIERQQAKLEQERLRLQQQRQAEWTRRNTRLVYTPRGNDRSNGAGYYNGNANANSNRLRVYRNGGYYNTDTRGADLLRQAVNEGYRQGFSSGRANNNRRGDWSTSNVYRSGTAGYQSYVDRGQYQYYFRQGFQRGYQDGTNSQYQEGYNGNYQYGSNNGGTLNILGTILNQILNIQSY